MGECKVNNPGSNAFNYIKIGIIGCGHLGQAILESLINHGFFKENIFISYKGNPSTYGLSTLSRTKFIRSAVETQPALNN
jgi:pyrroline-5-carboxylate reductase